MCNVSKTTPEKEQCVSAGCVIDGECMRPPGCLGFLPPETLLRQERWGLPGDRIKMWNSSNILCSWEESVFDYTIERMLPPRREVLLNNVSLEDWGRIWVAVESSAISACMDGFST